MPRLPLEAIRCQAMDESCKKRHSFFTVHNACSVCRHLTILACRLCLLSGEYALAEYSEVKTVTIKLRETIWEEPGNSSSLHFPSHQAAHLNSLEPTYNGHAHYDDSRVGPIYQSIQYIRALKEEGLYSTVLNFSVLFSGDLSELLCDLKHETVFIWCISN